MSTWETLRALFVVTAGAVFVVPVIGLLIGAEDREDES